jgi:hypothetical protein
VAKARAGGGIGAAATVLRETHGLIGLKQTARPVTDVGDVLNEPCDCATRSRSRACDYGKLCELGPPTLLVHVSNHSRTRRKVADAAAKVGHDGLGKAAVDTRSSDHEVRGADGAATGKQHERVHEGTDEAQDLRHRVTTLKGELAHARARLSAKRGDSNSNKAQDAQGGGKLLL